MDRCGDPQLEVWAAATDSADHGGGDGLDVRFVGQRLQPRDQPVHIGAVGDDNGPKLNENLRTGES